MILLLALLRKPSGSSSLDRYRPLPSIRLWSQSMVTVYSHRYVQGKHKQLLLCESDMMLERFEKQHGNIKPT
jgi:hypothetical protein